MSWTCLLVTGKRDPAVIKTELESVFASDFNDFFVIMDGNGGEDRYAFLDCDNYQGYVSDLRALTSVVAVLPSYDSPEFVPESEVDSFRQQVKERESRKYVHGDIVIVKRGYLKGLTGVVMRPVICGIYKVAFRFFTRSMSCAIHGQSLDFVENLFDTVRFPVLPYGRQGVTGRVPVQAMSKAALREYWKKVICASVPTGRIPVPIYGMSGPTGRTPFFRVSAEARSACLRMLANAHSPERREGNREPLKQSGSPRKGGLSRRQPRPG